MNLDLEIEPEEWHEQSIRWGHPIHSMCSYMASFPPRVPHYFIERFTKKGDIVLDPFSGRGTTPAEACLMGRVGIGNDLNPIAYVLTKAKVKIPSLNRILSRISQLKMNYKFHSIRGVPDKIKMLYSTQVIRQLLYLQDALNYEKKIVDNFIMAIILGGMHGDSSKPSYLSIPMPNTFSMSPNYVKNFIEKHSLKPPKHDVFDVIHHRLNRIYKEKIFQTRGYAFNEDIRDISTKLKKIKADLIFTSPPYLKLIKYGKLNWIRLWMLGIEPHELDKKLDDKHTVTKYMEFMKETINILPKLMKDDALCFIVVGQVSGNRGPGNNKSIELGTSIMEELNGKVKLNFMKVIDDEYQKHTKVSRIWGKTKGKATTYDQILVLCKDLKYVRTKKFKKEVNW